MRPVATIRSMSDPALDDLVETITARVKARLGNSASPSLPLVDSPCEEDPKSCTGCGHCVVRRPMAARSVASEGAARIGAGPGTGEVPSDRFPEIAIREDSREAIPGHDRQVAHPE